MKSRIQQITAEVLNPHPNKQTLQVVMIIVLIALISVVSFTAGVSVGEKIDHHNPPNIMPNDETMKYYNKLSRQIELSTSKLSNILSDPFLTNKEDAKTWIRKMQRF